MQQNDNAVRPAVPKINKKTNALAESKPGVKWLLLGEMDRPFLLIVITLLCIGSIMVFSASYAFAETRFGGDSYYFARRQLRWVIVGVSVMVAVAKFVKYDWLRRWARMGFFAALGLNIIVPVYGYASHGATRWIQIGSFNLQPSELMKFFIILWLSVYISKNYGRMNGFRRGILPFMIYGGAAAAAIVFQRHLSATLIILMLVVSMMFLSGLKSKWFIVAIVVLLIVAILIVGVFGDYLMENFAHSLVRVKVWQNPFEYMKDAETGDAGWQPAQSLYAIASGGFWGLGLGRSNQKHGYLPEPQNDYIFAILCEELGFFGALIVIGLFIAFAWRGFHIAKNAPTKFTQLLVMGIIIQVCLQVILNIAVVTNTIPSTGITLPFFSYGGTSLTILLAEMGIILSISRYSYTEKGV